MIDPLAAALDPEGAGPGRTLAFDKNVGATPQCFCACAAPSRLKGENRRESADPRRQQNLSVLHFPIEDRSGETADTSAVRRIMQRLGEPPGDAIRTKITQNRSGGPCQSVGFHCPPVKRSSYRRGVATRKQSSSSRSGSEWPVSR
jgi:hypothetical protein